MKKTPATLPKEVRVALVQIAELRLDELWEEADSYGFWVTSSDLPTRADYNKSLAAHWFKGLVDQNRLQALTGGSSPTAAEIKAYQDNWLDSCLSSEADADSIPAYALATVQDDQEHEGVALILRKGYSFSEITTWLEGVFASEQQAIQHMEKDGWRREA